MLFTTVKLKNSQANIFIYTGTKVFQTIYGYGIYEGQCDKDGNSCGEGRWLCTESAQFTDHRRNLDYKGCTFQGMFKNDCPEGFGELELASFVSHCLYHFSHLLQS